MNQIERDAYQIAENTPKESHSIRCHAIGGGSLISEVPSNRLCSCYIFDLALEIAKEINQ